MDLKVRGLAGSNWSTVAADPQRNSVKTYYAGNSNTLRAAATTATCVMEGYRCAMSTTAGVEDSWVVRRGKTRKHSSSSFSILELPQGRCHRALE